MQEYTCSRGQRIIRLTTIRRVMREMRGRMSVERRVRPRSKEREAGEKPSVVKQDWLQSRIF